MIDVRPKAFNPAFANGPLNRDARLVQWVYWLATPVAGAVLARFISDKGTWGVSLVASWLIISVLFRAYAARHKLGKVANPSRQ